jgi:hypothetical protein
MMNTNKPASDLEIRPSASRIGLATLIILLGVAYTGSIVLGLLPESRKIGSVDLATLVLAAVAVVLLFRPQVFTRLKSFETPGFRLELSEVKRRQADQERQLRDIDLLLPILLPGIEQEYLRTLSGDTARAYRGSHELRTSLRRLRSINLIRMRPGKAVCQIKDDSSHNLNEYVELTRLGEDWVARITEIENARNADQVSDASNV